MKILDSVHAGAFRGLRRATSSRWLQLSLAVGLLATVVLASVPPAVGADQASEQLEFGTNMAKRGLWKEALFRFKQADRLRPNDPRILNNVAVAYEALGLFDQALEAYQAALRAGPSERQLKGNYSSFAEFYQNFRPREDEGQQEAGVAGADATVEATSR